ncbi:MAG: DUF4011 domain-containing protein [Kiritimatiellaeota bacterium]|nr:DUF4011 domain-containing protein [Kiritimatiellota bacterium]
MDNERDEMMQADSEENLPLILRLEIPEEHRLALHETKIVLDARIRLQIKSHQLGAMRVLVSFNSLDLDPVSWEISSSQLDPDSELTLDIPPLERSSGEAFCFSKIHPLEIKVCVEIAGEQIAADSQIVNFLPPAQLSVDISSAYSIVSHQNQFPLISRLDLMNSSLTSFGLTKVVAEFDPPDFQETVWHVDTLAPGQSISLKERDLKLSASTLDKLSEERHIQLRLSVYTDDLLLTEVSKDIRLLPKTHWGGELHMSELLAAFITPNTPYCDRVLKKASNLLARDGLDSRLDGYQSNKRERPYMVAAAIWSVICNEGISYCEPPASFAKSGQKVRLSSEISKSLLATCLDTALLFASCLEQAGLNSVIALTKKHATVGVWLLNESFPLLTNDDPVDLRNRIALQDLILFETTFVTANQPIQFAQAIRNADKKIAEDSEDDFILLLDVKQARSRQIKPIDFGEEGAVLQAEGLEKKEVGLPPPPVLPPIVEPAISDEELTPAGRVEQWRRKLLDLSKRNKLLNISQRSLGFKIICRELDLLEDELASGKKYNIVSLEKLKTSGRSNEQYALRTGDDLEDDTVRDQLQRGSLVADISERDLEKNLINLFRRAKSDLEEGGSNTLFLTIGTLRWKDDPGSEKSYKAPLILLPVKLERSSARAKPKIKQLPDEDPIFNLTLIELLSQDFEIDLSCFQNELPKDESGIDVKRIWNIVRQKIKDTPGFEVIEELFLSNFSFAKYLMWKDLSDRLDDLKKSPLVNHLVEKPGSLYPHRAEFIAQEDVDEKIKPEEFFAPLNADSSQMVAVDASTKGKDFVLEGPPGTGKSETIANIIAHNIALGKKVLFVSEKMAALDVVYSRLKQVSLGHLCLELHSNKATKKGIVDQLGDAWQNRTSFSQKGWLAKASDLGALRKALNAYVEELHRKGALGYSPWDAIKCSTRDVQTLRIDLGWPRDLAAGPLANQNDVINAKSVTHDLALAFKEVAEAPFLVFKTIDVPDWSPVWQANLIDSAGRLSNAISSFDPQFDAFVDALGVPRPKCLSVRSLGAWSDVAAVCIASASDSHQFALSEDAKMLLEQLDEVARLKGEYDDLLSSSGVTLAPEEIQALPIAEWKEQTAKKASNEEQYIADKAVLEKLKSIGIAAQQVSDERSSDILHLTNICGCSLEHDELIKLPLATWMGFRDEVKDKNTILRKLSKYKINKQLRSHGLSRVKDLEELDNYAQLTEAVVQQQHESLVDGLKQAEAFSELAQKLAKLFSQYRNDRVLGRWSSTPEQILRRKEYGLEVRRKLMSAASQLDDPAEFMQAVRKKLINEQEFLEESPLVQHSKKILEGRVELDSKLSDFGALAQNSDLAEMDFPSLQNLLGDIKSSAHYLSAWCHWVAAKKKAEALNLHALVEGLENKLIGWDEAESEFESALCNWLAPLLISASEVLCRFGVAKHEDLIQQFRQLDEEVAKTTGKFIAAKLASEMPDTSGPDAPREYGLLAKEIQRQRRHKPVRQLIQELGACLLDLTPCFMMSPLSVAQYLPADYKGFDLVVFDEASQITVWDAVGAIARGKNVIIVGDPKQMPPTNFFNRAMDDDGSDEADLESILDQGLATKVACHRLTGHYRSRHESLIAFSNHRYYNNGLTTYPCAETRESALIWHRVAGLYSRGKGKDGRTNPIEAQALVNEVIRRLKDPELQKLSIGIVALNTEQQQLIENLLDDARRNDPSLERFFRDDRAEPVFVKNLETVQGDQRDVICLSVGYGPTEPEAQTMSMNFGPLNRKGGERRLNVAITRASTEMLLFTSFDASMIDLSRTSSEAVKDLKAYIDYAARGPVALAQRTEFSNEADQFDSDFEQAIASKLRKKGWQVRTQIGVSKFRIDLGVLDPDVSGSFLAGVECDGATYHSSPSARDRDRVRHIILENLGWTLVRIWSTDYFINPDGVIDRVHKRLEEILQIKREERERLRKEQERLHKEQARIEAEAQKNNDEDNFAEDEEDPEHEVLQNQKTETEAEDNVWNDIESDEETQQSELLIEINPLAHNIEQYEMFDGEPFPDPRNTNHRFVSKGLLEIIKVEGPVVAKRAYDIYLRLSGIKRMGKDLKRLMNRALQHAIDNLGVIKDDELGSGGLLYSIVRLPENSTPRLRTLGDRTIDEIPLVELKAASNLILTEEKLVVGSEEHCRAILNLYGLKRLTDHTRETILSAINKKYE